MLRALQASRPELAGRIQAVAGDIAEPGLGLSAGETLLPDLVEVFHLAAVYDLGVSRALGQRVNVHGTRQVLAFAARAPHLARVHYVSTCYVSGRRPGPFLETDLECGQVFNNAYEETKYLAEVEVRTHMTRGLPATIYRPSIVVGDASTGETQKYDGPYAAFRWLLRQGRVAVMPTVGRTDRTRLNLVPRDFVVAAIDHLSALDTSRGRTYQLADPAPLTVAQVLEAFGRAAGRRIVTVRLPLAVARGALASVPGMRALLGLSPESIDYFVHPATYDTSNADRDLAGSGIAVPRFERYVDALVTYMRAHPDVASTGLH